MANLDIKKGQIGNALESIAPDHVVVTADGVFDEDMQKYQSEINQDAVLYTPQTPTEEQKAQARENLGLGDGVIDEEPAAGSERLVTSGGVYLHTSELEDAVSSWSALEKDDSMTDDGHYWRSNGQKGESSNYRVDTYYVEGGRCKICGCLPKGSSAFFYVWLDANGDFLKAGEIQGSSESEAVQQIFDKITDVPTGAAYIALNVYKIYEKWWSVKGHVAEISSEAIQEAADRRVSYGGTATKLIGKKVSVIGASIDTFYPLTYGFWPSDTGKENPVRGDRYPGTLSNNYNRDNDVNDVEQTWWMQVIKRCGAVLERNNSIGSSGITINSEKNQGTEGTGRPCFLRRYTDLGNPDVIFIHGLSNETSDTTFKDFTPDEYVFRPEDFDPATFGVNPTVSGNIDFGDLGQAYYALIKLLQYTYPDARIIHVVGKNVSVERTEKAIEIFKYFGQEYVDCHHVKGMITTLGGSAADKVHPNAQGMQAMADYIMNVLVGSDDLHELKEKVADLQSTALEEVEIPTVDEDVAGYITDKKRTVIGKLMSNGAVEWLVDNSRDKQMNLELEYIEGHITNIDELLSYVSEEIPDSYDGIIKYLTDKDGRIIGWVTTSGKVHVIDLEAETLKVNGDDFKPGAGMPEQIFPLLGFLANGTMKDFVNDKAYNLLASMSKGVYTKDGLPVSVEPTIVIHDDDAIDSQIPSSFNGTVPVANKGGYASCMLPMIMSLNARYGNSINAKNHKIVVGIAAEGQRIGLTPMYDDEDTFTGEMNANGKILNKIIEHEGWEALCHSMTARYINASYIVKGLASNFADVLKTNSYVSTNYHSYLHTTVYDTMTQKNYYLKLDRSGWDELPKQYNKPYLATYIVVDGTTIVNEDFRSEYDAGRKLIINPTYSVEYQVKTWFERAKEAGLHYIDAGVQWGSSQSTWHMREGLKYCSFFFSRHGDYNTIPIDTNAIRLNNSAGLDGSDNAYTDERYTSIISKINSCIADNGLMVFMNHSNTDYFNNYYMAGTTYYTRTQPSETGRLDYYDANYPPSWRIPLNGTQLTEMLNDPDCPYWTTPPLKKRNTDGTLSNTDMESWADWYPCPGTKMALIYDYLTYAISQGVRFASSSEAIDKFGNMLNIGIKKTNGTDWQADPLLGNIPEQNGSHYVIGADGSIDCEIV